MEVASVNTSRTWMQGQLHCLISKTPTVDNISSSHWEGGLPDSTRKLQTLRMTLQTI